MGTTYISSNTMDNEPSLLCKLAHTLCMWSFVLTVLLPLGTLPHSKTAKIAFQCNVVSCNGHFLFLVICLKFVPVPT
jgi:hypothetical protein